MAAIKGGTCDIGSFGIDPIRTAEADFSPPLLQEDYTYLMPAGSSIRTIADALWSCSIAFVALASTHVEFGAHRARPRQQRHRQTTGTRSQGL
jgi:hypothetical protein